MLTLMLIINEDAQERLVKSKYNLITNLKNKLSKQLNNVCIADNKNHKRLRVLL